MTSPIPRVLVIDDEALVGRLVARMLQCRYDVHAVLGGAEALRLLESGEAFDLVLCDVEMPQVDGFGVRDEIATRWPALASRIVFMTGRDLGRGSAPVRGAAAVLAKPFTPEQLLAFVADRLARAERD